MDLNIPPSEQEQNMPFTDFELKCASDFPLAANVQLHHTMHSSGFCLESAFKATGVPL
jgi:hypothetical protein